jgi:hypothetical protein
MKKILIVLTIVLTISFIGCSQDEPKLTTKNRTEVNPSLYTKDGDTLAEKTTDFEMGERLKKLAVIDTAKIELDTTVSEVTSTTYGRASISCRNPYTLDWGTGGSYQVASGCVTINGSSYAYTWTPGHYEFDGELHSHWVPAHSTYTYMLNCHCSY